MSYQERLAAEGRGGAGVRKPRPGPKPAAAWYKYALPGTQRPLRCHPGCFCAVTELGSDSHPAGEASAVCPLVFTGACRAQVQSGGPGARRGTGPSACLSSMSCTQIHTRDEAVQKWRLRQSWYVTAGVGDACRCRFLVPLPHPRPRGVDRQEVPLPPPGPWAVPSPGGRPVC